ncbi:sulfatase [bacterium]|nr:sulfatase [bacterium]
MRRRDFLRTAGGLTAASLLPSLPLVSCGGGSSPNILLICVDDLRPELGCYGAASVKSPNLDGFAETAVRFTHHYIQAPTCGPSRYSLLTGLRPRTVSELNNEFMERTFHTRPEGAVPETFVHHFRRNGYYTVGIGKVSHMPDGIIRGDGRTRELPYSWDEMLCEKEKWGDGFDAFFAYADGSSRASMNHQVEPLECADVDDEGYPDGRNAALAAAKLKELAGREQPFLLSAGFFKPHLPFNSPKKYWDLYKRDEIPLSPNPEAPRQTPPGLLHNSDEFFNNYRIHDERGGAGIRIGDAYARKIRHAYFAAVSYVDAQIGRVLTALKESGRENDTIVIVWGDHGWHLGDHTLWGKHSPFERSANSPLMIRVPGMRHPGTASDAIIETIDIYPTLCGLCGIAPPPELDGKPLTPLIRRPEGPGKQAAYTCQPGRISMRTGRYRLVVQYRGGTWTIALFDHAADPYETVNIAPEHPDIVQKLLPLLRKGNTGIIPDAALKRLIESSDSAFTIVPRTS